MAVPYAEVIGDPIEHSKSPLIHRFWLEKLGLKGDYRAVRVTPRDLAAYLESRRGDVFWRGCNVTAPLKQDAARLVGAPAGLCDFVGAVNCITRTPLACLIGTNTDLVGIGEALKGVAVKGERVVLIGAGGAARAAACFLVRQQAGELVIVARSTEKASELAKLLAPMINVRTLRFEEAADSVRGVGLVVNATPLGMIGKPPMPDGLPESLSPGQIAFDMVYAPVETAFLAAARARGAKAVDGLAMLIGQAAPAFELFFGTPAPREHDGELRERLAA